MRMGKGNGRHATAAAAVLAAIALLLAPTQKAAAGAICHGRPLVATAILEMS